jgi:hypothetical protein
MNSKDLFDGMNRERRSLNLPRRRTPRRVRCIHRSLAARLDPISSSPSIFLNSWPCKRRAADLRNLAMDPATGGSLADPLGQTAKAIGMSKPAIAAAIRKGRISGSNDLGRFVIEHARIHRIYPPAANPASPPNETDLERIQDS